MTLPGFSVPSGAEEQLMFLSRDQIAAKLGSHLQLRTVCNLKLLSYSFLELLLSIFALQLTTGTGKQ